MTPEQNKIYNDLRTRFQNAVNVVNKDGEFKKILVQLGGDSFKNGIPTVNKNITEAGSGMTGYREPIIGKSTSGSTIYDRYSAPKTGKEKDLETISQKIDNISSKTFQKDCNREFHNNSSACKQRDVEMRRYSKADILINASLRADSAMDGLNASSYNPDKTEFDRVLTNAKVSVFLLEEEAGLRKKD
jgi:hypothetical protein